MTMTDSEYALIIYRRIFNAYPDAGCSYVTGAFKAIGTLSSDEQAALENYYRHGKTFNQTGEALGSIKGEAARRLVLKAVLKLKHPSRLKYITDMIDDEVRDD